ncbi:MAG: hypothetical protein ACYTEZ_17655 [Planctomycetota bacterium]
MPEHRLDFVEDLDRLGCDVAGCDHTTHDGEVYLHSRCHPDVPTWSSYRAGVLSVWCAACGRQVCAVAVAPRAAAR